MRRRRPEHGGASHHATRQQTGPDGRISVGAPSNLFGFNLRLDYEYWQGATHTPCRATLQRSRDRTLLRPHKETRSSPTILESVQLRDGQLPIAPVILGLPL